MSENEKKDAPPDFGAVKPPEPKQEPEEKAAAPKSEKKAAPKRRVTPRAPSLESQLEDAFNMISIGIATTGDMYCAEIVARQSKPLANAWAELAKVNPRVEAILNRMMEGSAWGGVIFTTAATVIPIAAHHGFYPKGFPMPFEFGLGPPPPPSEEVKKERDKK